MRSKRSRMLPITVGQELNSSGVSSEKGRFSTAGTIGDNSCNEPPHVGQVNRAFLESMHSRSDRDLCLFFLFILNRAVHQLSTKFERACCNCVSHLQRPRIFFC